MPLPAAPDSFAHPKKHKKEKHKHREHSHTHQHEGHPAPTAEQPKVPQADVPPMPSAPVPIKQEVFIKPEVPLFAAPLSATPLFAAPLRTDMASTPLIGTTTQLSGTSAQPSTVFIAPVVSLPPAPPPVLLPPAPVPAFVKSELSPFGESAYSPPPPEMPDGFNF